MAGNTKNLGQVSGVYIGSTPPENIIMIWYDNTPSQMVHKVYNPGLSQWVVLDQNVISLITYSELVNIATNVGLTVGQWFKITDKSNALALAVTSTKVQYSDSLGNILIDDLGSNIQYHVSSSNLSIDDVIGVFDEVNKKLVFQFNEQVPDYTADDYILGKVKRNNVWSLVKFKLSSFLSSVTGNSITWNGGFFFNFSNAISAILDKVGGVVSKDTYDIDKQNIATDIQNVGKENQTIIENANTAISNATSATAIYDKQISVVETGGEPTDVATGDRLITIVSKFQRYINKFKFATGIRVATNFADAVNPEYVNNNDTVDSAIRKIQYWIKKQKTGDNIAVSSNTFPVLSSKPADITKDDMITTALSKLVYLVEHIEANQIIDNIIDLSKIAKYGVLSTDIMRLDVITFFDMTGCGIGGIMTQYYDDNFFVSSVESPYNPYRLTKRFDINLPKIFSFIPVVPVIPNVSNQYSNASTLVHYVDGDVTIQFILQITKERYDALYTEGNRYLKGVIQVDVYGSLTDEQTIYINMRYVNIFNVSLRQSSLTTGSNQHIIFKATITPVVDSNS